MRPSAPLPAPRCSFPFPLRRRASSHRGRFQRCEYLPAGIELTGKVSDVIIYPTGHYRGGDPLTSADLPPVFALINDPPAGAPLELAPVDGYRFERDNLYPFSYPGLDPVTGNLLPTPSGAMGDQYVTDRQVPRYETTEVIREIVEAGVVPVFSPFDLTQFRLVYHLAREGQVPQPAFTQIMLYGDRLGVFRSPECV